jgi:molybdate transport system substrate-binding protein
MIGGDVRANIILSIGLLSLGVLLTGCLDFGEGKKKELDQLLIYSGITMIRPMSEIAELTEKKCECKITITKGGSGNLLKSILYNKVGDIYLPGSDRYYKIISQKHQGLVTKMVPVGHNRAVMMVQKGNPKGITGLDQLTSREFGVMIGNPDSGSIGKEAKKILEKRGIYEGVVKNVMSLTTDSKDLVRALVQRKADVVINWFAASTWDENPQHIDVVEIPAKFVKTKKLVLGLLKYSAHPQKAKIFMDIAASAQGRDIFRRHGLYFD